MSIAAGGGVNDVISRFQKLQDDANKANEVRYKELLAEIRKISDQTGSTYDAAGGLIANIGDTARTRVNQGETRQQARGEQDLISRGLGNTTIRESVRRGIADDAELQRQGIDEQVGLQQSSLLRDRAGANIQVGGLLAGAIEGRNDVGPNMSLYADLIQQLRAAQGASQQANVAVGRGLPPSIGGGGFGGGFGGGGSTGGGSGGGSGGGEGGSGGGGGSAGGTQGARIINNQTPNPRVFYGTGAVTPGGFQPSEPPTPFTPSTPSPQDLAGETGWTGSQFFKDLTSFKFR